MNNWKSLAKRGAKAKSKKTVRTSVSDFLFILHFVLCSSSLLAAFVQCLFWNKFNWTKLRGATKAERKWNKTRLKTEQWKSSRENKLLALVFAIECPGAKPFVWRKLKNYQNEQQKNTLGRRRSMAKVFNCVDKKREHKRETSFGVIIFGMSRQYSIQSIETIVVGLWRHCTCRSISKWSK